MTDLLLTNITLPEEGTKRIILNPDGSVQEVNSYNEAVTSTNIQTLTLPPHGPLVDSDGLVAVLLQGINLLNRKPQTTRRDSAIEAFLHLIKMVQQAPVIVPEHREENGGK